MTLLPHVAARLFGAPLLIHRPKLDVILAVLGPRVGLSDLAAPSGYTPPERSTGRVNAKVAVVPIHGTLVRRTIGLEAESGLTSYAAIASQIDAALASPEVAAILLDVDSPGGESGGVFDLADRIRSAAQVKPVWAVANDMAFSAAYALASAATKVFVSRTGGVGSIGVIAMHVDQSEKDAQDGVRYTAVFAGDRKNDLNPHEPISDEAHAFLAQVGLEHVGHRDQDGERRRALQGGRAPRPFGQPGEGRSRAGAGRRARETVSLPERVSTARVVRGRPVAMATRDRARDLPLPAARRATRAPMGGRRPGAWDRSPAPVVRAAHCNA